MPAAKKQATTEAAPNLGAAILAGPGVGVEEMTATPVTESADVVEPVTLADATETAVDNTLPASDDALAVLDALAAAPVNPTQGAATAYPTPSKPKPRAEAPAPSAKGAVRLTTVLVKISRDLATKFEARVFKHEVPCLAVIHGLDNIENFEELEETEEEVFLDRFSPVDEFLRLKQRYDRRNMDVVEKAYPAGPVTIAQIAGVEVEAMRKSQIKASAQHIRSREGQVRRQRS